MLTLRGLSSGLAPDARYALSCEPDGAGVCLCCLQLLRAEHVVSSVELGACSSPQIAPTAASADLGLGDPLGEPGGWTVWRVGSELDPLRIAALPVRMGPQAEGLLLRAATATGAHDMLVLREGARLVRLNVEGDWSALAARPASGEALDQLTLFAHAAADSGMPWLSEARWQPAGNALRIETREDSRAFLAVIGPYADRAAAQAMPPDCLRASSLTSTDAYAGLPEGQFVLAAISGERALAERAVARAQCAPAAERGVVPLRFRDKPFARFELDPALHVLLGFGRYDGFGWPVLATLKVGAGAQAPVEVAWPVVAPRAVPATDVAFPAGDPLEPSREGWQLGGEGTGALLHAQRVRLGQGHEGILISAEAGFEHTKRRHTLLDVHAGQLRVLHRHLDAQGPTWSTIIVRPRDAESDEVLLISERESLASEGEQPGPDALSIERAAYAAERDALVVESVPCHPAILRVVRRYFGSLRAAVAAKAQDCAAPDDNELAASIPWLALPAPTQGQPGRFMLAQVTTAPDAAAKLVKQLTHCWKDARPALVRDCAQPQARHGER